MTNPRWKSGKRRKYQARFKAMQMECAICHGRFGPINYDSSDPKDPKGFVIDEIIPVSKWQVGGFRSAADCADCWDNLQPAHRQCNAMKGNKLNYKIEQSIRPKEEGKRIVLDGKW